MSLYVHGLDLGQAQDYTAHVIINVVATPTRIDVDGQWLHTEVPPVKRYNFVHIERFPLGTKYQAIAAIMQQRMVGTPAPKYFALDQTGVGNAAIEMFAACNPIGITITGGSNVTPGEGPQMWRVPKRDLVTALQVATQNHLVKFAAGLQHAKLLEDEMLNFRAKISTTGHDTYEAWREGKHDDLVLAAAIGCWVANETLRVRLMQIQDAIRSRAAAVPYQISPI